jgi:type VI secretion system protein VasG
MTILDLRVMVSRLTPALRPSLERAVGRAASRSHEAVEIEHWLAELVESDREFQGLLAALDVSPRGVGDEAARAETRLKPGPGSSAPPLSRRLIAWIEEAWYAASLRFGRNVIVPADLLVAIAADGAIGAYVRETAPSLRFDEAGAAALANAAAPADQPAGASLPGAPLPGRSTGADLAAFAIDLTAEARAGRIDPVVGREAELRQVIDVLMRRRQNNPILTGEAGVGKTAIVEALARRIADGDVPAALRDVDIHALDLGLLQAGAGVKGEFERRLKGVIDDIRNAPRPVILFVDEAHMLIGAGNPAGHGDAANLIKPALARGELRTIAATTWSEYKRYFERDAALTRRFQVVRIDEPGEDTAVHMLRGLAPALEAHHRVRIRDEALREAVRLSSRYIPARQLPDKAVSLLDTAAAAVAISRSTIPPAIADLEHDRALLMAEHATLAREPTVDRPQRLATLDGRIGAIDEQLAALRLRLDTERRSLAEADAAESAGDLSAVVAAEQRSIAARTAEPLVHRVVDRDAVAAVAARWTGIPVGRLARDEVEIALSLKERLERRIIGQDLALALITAAMKTSGARLADPRKPTAVFLMVGPSGVGKTETAHALAELLYGGVHCLTTINMSEFKEEHKVSTLVGSPPGYVGFGEGGVLTEAVRRRPYGVLLLDEMEKAHTGVQELFYQVFDKGTLRDGEGRDIDFRHTTIVMTANAGAEMLSALGAGPAAIPGGEGLVEMVRPELLRHFKPAFLGRLTIVPYRPLGEAVLRDIARLQLRSVVDRLFDAHGIELIAEPQVENRLAARCFAADIGARAIEGIINREILPRISTAVLEHAVSSAGPQRFTLTSGPGEVFNIKTEPAAVHEHLQGRGPVREPPPADRAMEQGTICGEKEAGPEAQQERAVSVSVM